MSTMTVSDPTTGHQRIRRIDLTAAATVVVGLVFCGLLTAKVHAVATAEGSRGEAASALRGTALGGVQADRLVDLDADGEDDALRVLVGLHVERPGRYQLAATLRGSGSVQVTSAPWERRLDAGARTAALDFRLDGPRRLGVGGPYVLTDGVLTRGDDPRIVAQRAIIGATSAVSIAPGGTWPRTMPQPQPALRDDNEDGLFDRLSWLFQPEVATPGDYLVEGVLVDPSGRETPGARIARLQLPGTQAVALDFPASAVQDAGSGVYTIGRVRITQIGGPATFVTGVRGHTVPLDLERWAS